MWHHFILVRFGHWQFQVERLIPLNVLTTVASPTNRSASDRISRHDSCMPSLCHLQKNYSVFTVSLVVIKCWSFQALTIIYLKESYVRHKMVSSCQTVLGQNAWRATIVCLNKSTALVPLYLSFSYVRIKLVFFFVLAEDTSSPRRRSFMKSTTPERSAELTMPDESDQIASRWSLSL